MESKVLNDQRKWTESARVNQREADPQRALDDQKKQRAKSRVHQREVDKQKVYDDQKRWKAESIEKQRNIDNKQVKDNQSKRKAKSIGRQRENNDQQVKDDQSRRKRLSRNKRKLVDPIGLSTYEIEAQQKKRRLWSAKDRLRDFKEATKYNAIFICSCCHRRLFHSNVAVITQKLRENINERKLGHFIDCVEEEIATPINGENDCYLCKTCITHMKEKKMPPMAASNKLRLEVQDENLQLTELEGALIAKNLIFQKIYQLPKSRWTALTDRIINVPINDEDILNTVQLLPRTPKEAGLIGVSLKRRLEYKITHKRQLVNPEKILRMLDMLKKAKNPFYQFHDDFNTYAERCKIDDPEGHRVIFPEDDELEEEIDMMPNGNNDILTDEIMKKPSLRLTVMMK